MTGIPRVARNLARHGASGGRALGIEVVPVVSIAGRWFAVDVAYLGATPSWIRRQSKVVRDRWRLARRWIKATLRGQKPTPPGSPRPASPVDPGTGSPRPNSRTKRFPAARDRWRRFRHRLEARISRWFGGITAPIALAEGDLLLLTEGLCTIEIEAGVAAAHAANTDIAVVMYDLIPVLFPETTNYDTPAQFARFLDLTARYARSVTSISKATSDDFARWWATHHPDRPLPALSWFRLGADMDSAPGLPPREALSALIASARQAGLVLMVGTIEPRKNHALAIDAMQPLWAAAPTAPGPALMLIGGEGWRSDEFLARLRAHPEFGRRLHWIRDARDSEIDQAYRAARLLLMPSTAEGFGLPIVEGLTRGLPVLASDIAVHREIGGSSCTYLPPGDAQPWSHAIAGHLHASAPDRPAPAQPPFLWPDWAASTREMLERLLASQSTPQTASSTPGLAQPSALPTISTRT